MGLNRIFLVTVLIGHLGVLFPVSGKAWAHCDTMSGSVVQAAKNALEEKNVNRILIWVQEKDEAEMKEVFRKTLSVRKLNSEAKNLADQYFFETVVRIHRAGEGAPYTGLKPADTDLGPAIPCADKALEEGKVDRLLKLITDEVKKGVREHFERVMEKKNFNMNDVAAGREYVEAYVIYTHYIEQVYEAAAHSVKGHYAESKEGTEEVNGH